MLATIIAASILCSQAGQQEPSAPAEPASKIVEKSLQRYSSAKSVSGVVTLKQRALNTEVQIDTYLQFDRPNKIYLRQVKHPTSQSPAKEWMVSSGPKTFSYTKPPGVFSKQPVITEAIVQNNYALTVGDMYTPVRTALEDANAMIEIAIGRSEDLKALMAQWATMQVHSKVEIDGKEATAIVGAFRHHADGPESGSYEAYFTKDYDFIRYVLKQKFAVPGRPNEQIEVTSIWNSNLAVNAKTDPKLYKG